MHCLWEGLKKGSYGTMMYHPFFLLRRILLLYAAFMLSEMPAVQCLIFLVGSMISLTYMVAVQPFSEFKDNIFEIYNESIVMLMSYYYVSLTNMTLNVEQM